ncbi:Bug family tripartite tricarboxylate transporter substrate binding protein [Antarctobacter sp.]|uniref:Bug family tripartite tricarboxylate transporter substrate binding protein n=1 Tax=Antarctobacter sp. TaxID=1872577 RepID=UPI003A8E6A7B
MKFKTLILLAGGLLAPAIAAAQSDYPTRTVTMIIPFSAGGSNDTIGRYLSERLASEWDQTVVAENRPGAGAAVGANYVVQSDPDGYTLMFVSGTLTTTGATRKNLPFDPIEDLQPVGIGAIGKMIIVTGNRLPLPSLQAVADTAKQETVFYGTTGIGSLTQFAAENFANVADIQMEPVHYGGGTDALLDLAGGRLDIYTGSVTQVLSQIEAGNATPVAVSSKTRASVLPNVPTIGEAGFPGGETDVWWGVFAPAGTPDDIVQKINSDINKVMNSADGAAFLEKLGAEPAKMSVEEFTSHVHAELEKWTEIAGRLGLSVE